jgi:hypothetical protein
VNRTGNCVVLASLERHARLAFLALRGPLCLFVPAHPLGSDLVNKWTAVSYNDAPEICCFIVSVRWRPLTRTGGHDGSS